MKVIEVGRQFEYKNCFYCDHALEWHENSFKCIKKHCTCKRFE